jgi:anti-sigma regulatory factor (Ser/Thr protein kinase)
MPRSACTEQVASLKLKLACDLAESRRAALEVRAFLAAQGCDETDAVDCELALVEACNNAIVYADPAKTCEPILVEVECRTSEIEVRVLDHTPGFEWPKEVTLPGPEMESGRGLYIIQTVTNHADYTRSPKGNLLVMRRSRTVSR